MICRVDLTSDPISLIIISANGKEHMSLDDVGHDGFIGVDLAPLPAPITPPAATDAQLQGDS